MRAEPSAPETPPRTENKESAEYRPSELVPDEYYARELVQNVRYANLHLEYEMKGLNRVANRKAHDSHIAAQRAGAARNRFDGWRDSVRRHEQARKEWADPTLLVNRLPFTGIISRGMMTYHEKRNEWLGKWRLEAAQDRMVAANKSLATANEGLSGVNSRRLELAHKMERAFDPHIANAEKELASIEKFIPETRAIVQSLEQKSGAFAHAIEQLRALQHNATSREEIDACEAAIAEQEKSKEEVDGYLEYHTQQVLNALEHQSRQRELVSLAGVARDGIAAKFDQLVSKGTERKLARIGPALPKLSSPTSATGSGLDTGTNGSSGMSDLMRVLAEFFPPTPKSTNDVIKAWNDFYVKAKIDAETLWKCAVEAGVLSAEQLAQLGDGKNSVTYKPEDWKNTLSTMLDKSPTFKALVSRAKLPKMTDRAFVEGFARVLRNHR